MTVPPPATPPDASSDTGYKYDHVPMGRKRKIRIITIGAGATGISNAFQVKTHMENVEHVAYDKNPDVGGTWYEQRYPGCACDIPSHSYTFAFEPYPEWPAYYSNAEDIFKYMKFVCEKHGLYDQFRLSHEITSARWDEDKSKWCVTVRGPDGNEFIDEADILINGSGPLNRWKWPDIPGLFSFKGHLVHSAVWDPSYDYTGKKIAIIGIGSTATQIVPNIQPIAGHLKCFVRSAAWITAGGFAEKHAGPGGTNFQYTEEQKQFFRDHPDEHRQYCKEIEDEINERYAAIEKDGPMQALAVDRITKAMKAMLPNRPDLQELLIPKFAVGCRRLTPGNGFLEALTSDNAEIISTPIERITEKGIVTADGVKHEVDALICATGFDVSLCPRFPFIDRKGVDLREKWATGMPEAYMSLLVEDCPNYFYFLGPSSPVGHGSILPILERSMFYVLKMVAKMQVEPIKSYTVKPEAMRDFYEHRNAMLKTTAWDSPCRSVFKNGTLDGPLILQWPGSRLHFFEMIKEPRFEDFEIRYEGNRFSFFGSGTMQFEVQGGDLSWYLSEGEPFKLEMPYYFNAEKKKRADVKLPPHDYELKG